MARIAGRRPASAICLPPPPPSTLPNSVPTPTQPPRSADGGGWDLSTPPPLRAADARLGLPARTADSDPLRPGAGRRALTTAEARRDDGPLRRPGAPAEAAAGPPRESAAGAGGAADARAAASGHPGKSRLAAPAGTSRPSPLAAGPSPCSVPGRARAARTPRSGVRRAWRDSAPTAAPGATAPRFAAVGRRSTCSAETGGPSLCAGGGAAPAVEGVRGELVEDEGGGV